MKRYITLIYGNTRGLINMLSEDIKMVADSLGMDWRKRIAYVQL